MSSLVFLIMRYEIRIKSIHPSIDDAVAPHQLLLDEEKRLEEELRSTDDDDDDDDEWAK